MTCAEYQNDILETLPQEYRPTLQNHLRVCRRCHAFEHFQQRLHERLASASSMQLNLTFRNALMKRIARDDISVWRDFLPDIAHLAGCSAATAAAIHILPWPVGSVLIGGIAFTAATYFFQSHLRDTRD